MANQPGNIHADDQPPADTEAEKAVLGSLMLNPEQIKEVGQLRPEHFYDDANREIFKAITRLAEAGVRFDDVTLLRSDMVSHGAWEIVGPGYLATVLNSAQNASLARYYAEIVHERWRQRKTLEGALRIAVSRDRTLSELLADLQALCEQVESGQRERQISPTNVAVLRDNHPDLRRPVVHGFLRQGETANIIAPPKTGKSFLAGNLAWCVATGRPWLSHDVDQGRVLVIDNELHPETLASRLTHIADELQVPLDERDQVEVISLRGKLTPIEQLQFTLAVEPSSYRLIVLDALYRMIPSGTSENDNAGMMAIYNHLDALAAKWECAIVVVHHTSKGAQGEKSLTDVGAGAGSISRAADTHIAIRPHETDGHHVLEAVTRSFKSPEPVSVTFQWPLWQATTLEPAVKSPTRKKKEEQAEDDARDADELLRLIPDGRAVQQCDLINRLPWGVGRSQRLLGRLIHEGHIEEIHRKKKGGRKRYKFYRRASRESSSECSSECSSEST